MEVPLLPLPPPFILVPVSVPLELVLVVPVPPADVLIVLLEPVESAMVPALLAVDSVPGALVEVLVPVSLPPQLLSARLPSSNAARGKREVRRCMKIKGKRWKHQCGSGIR